MNKLYMTLLLSGLSLLSFAQNNNLGSLNNNDGRALLSQRKLVGDSEVREGSPYPDGEAFKKISISGYSNSVQNLRYNACTDEMEYQKDNDVYSVSQEPGQVIRFEGGKVYECLNYSVEGKNKLGYLVQLVSNPEKYSLYKREKVELLKGEKSPNGITKDRNDYYAKEKDVYLIRTNGNFTKMSKNKKELLSDFPIKPAEIEKFIKEKQINFKSETDLVKLVTYMNTL